MIASSAALSGLIYDVDGGREPRHGAFSLPDFDAVRETLKIPPDVAIVPWDRVAKAGDTLGDVLDRLTADQLLGLPEREQPYLLDASGRLLRLRRLGGPARRRQAGRRSPRKPSAGSPWPAHPRDRRARPPCRHRRSPHDVALTRPARPASAEGPGRFYWDSPASRQGARRRPGEAHRVGGPRRLLRELHPRRAGRPRRRRLQRDRPREGRYRRAGRRLRRLARLLRRPQRRDRRGVGAGSTGSRT